MQKHASSPAIPSPATSRKLTASADSAQMMSTLVLARVQAIFEMFNSLHVHNFHVRLQDGVLHGLILFHDGTDWEEYDIGLPSGMASELFLEKLASFATGDRVNERPLQPLERIVYQQEMRVILSTFPEQERLQRAPLATDEWTQVHFLNVHEHRCSDDDDGSRRVSIGAYVGRARDQTPETASNA